MPYERARKPSGGHACRSHFAIQLGGDESSPEDLGLALSCGWLHIQRKESMKDVVSEEGHEEKTLDGTGVMLEDVIGVPFVDQLVEAIFLDVSSLVPQWTARSTEAWLGESVVAQIQSLLCGASCLSSCRRTA